MTNAVPKNNRIHIPARDRSIEVKARPIAATDQDKGHTYQVEKAFDKGFERYHRALKRLADI